jgi:type IV secretory pathway VirB10-like protein
VSYPPPLDDTASGDPRRPPADTATPFDASGDLRPMVAEGSRGGGLGWIFASALALGLITFFVLNMQHHAPGAVAPLSSSPSAEVLPAPPPPPDLEVAEAAARGGAKASTAPSATPEPSQAIQAGSPSLAPALVKPFAVDNAALGRKSPTVVVDLGDGSVGSTAASTPGGGGAASPATSGPIGRSDAAALNADEKFAARVGDEEPERSRATIIHNTRDTIPQGVMIPGVLETALNSDLPGFARAVVSRDVRGFDGSLVLIPRGSRVIGQYKSAVAQGQSRAFVVWTRIIRPDGASIQIASSGTDSLGRAGLDGKVDRHFFEQFSGAILLTVLDAGVTSLANQPSTQVVIGSSAGGTGLGASAITPTPLSPTIKVAQGSPIRIFVARDLDFSPVGAAK